MTNVDRLQKVMKLYWENNDHQEYFQFVTRYPLDRDGSSGNFASRFLIRVTNVESKAELY